MGVGSASTHSSLTFVDKSENPFNLHLDIWAVLAWGVQIPPPPCTPSDFGFGCINTPLHPLWLCFDYRIFLIHWKPLIVMTGLCYQPLNVITFQRPIYCRLLSKNHRLLLSFGSCYHFWFGPKWSHKAASTVGDSNNSRNSNQSNKFCFTIFTTS